MAPLALLPRSLWKHWRLTPTPPSCRGTSSLGLEPRPGQPRACQEVTHLQGWASVPQAGDLGQLHGDAPPESIPAAQVRAPRDGSRAGGGRCTSRPIGDILRPVLGLTATQPGEKGKGEGVEDSPPDGPSHLRGWEKRIPLGEARSAPNLGWCPPCPGTVGGEDTRVPSREPSPPLPPQTD